MYGMGVRPAYSSSLNASSSAGSTNLWKRRNALALGLERDERDALRKRTQARRADVDMKDVIGKIGEDEVEEV
jgi:hypothetical protein